MTTERNEANLKLLADHLRTATKAKAERFDMSVYFADPDDKDYELRASEAAKLVRERENYCGTAACALGHIVFIPELVDQLDDGPGVRSFWEACEILFGFKMSSETGEFLFDANWAQVKGQTDALAAARRIEMVLAGYQPERKEVSQYLENGKKVNHEAWGAA